MIMKTTVIKEPIKTYLYNNELYKNCVMSLRFYIPLEKLNNTKLSLYAQLIKDRNEKYPTKREMTTLKDNLYGCTITTKTFGYFNTQVLEVRVLAISDAYVKEPLSKQQIQTLAQLAYYPLLNEKTLLEAKQTLKSRLNRAIENPINRAIKQTFKTIGEGNTLAISTQGEIEDLDQITLEEMIEFKKYLFNTAKVHLLIAGNFNGNLNDILSDTFKSLDSLEKPLSGNVFKESPIELKIDQLPISQACLVQAYRTDIDIYHPLFYALRVGCIILGQLPNSHLFQEVREKRSLCYSVSSRIMSFEGLMLITTQLDQKNIELASNLMKEQVRRIINGDFTDSQFSSAINLLLSSFDSIMDDEISIINFMADSIIRDLPIDIEKQKQQYLSISKEQVIEAFKQVTCEFEYQLVGGQDENHQ